MSWLDPVYGQSPGIVIGGVIGWAISWYYYRKSRADSQQEDTEAAQREVVRPSRKAIEETWMNAKLYQRVDLTAAKLLKDKAAHWKLHSQADALSGLETPVLLYNEALGYAEKDISEALRKYGANVDGALDEEFSRLRGSVQRVRDILFNIRIYAEEHATYGPWLRAICIVFARCATFAPVGTPLKEGHGVNVVDVDGKYLLPVPDAIEEAARIFELGKTVLERNGVEYQRRELSALCELLVKH